MIQTDVTIEIDSRRCGRTYELLRFTEYDVDIDLETDADAFDIVAKNKNGIYTGLFCRFDNCRLKVNSKTIMEGNIDKISYYIKKNDDYIKITGRDMCWKLVDNDADPDTLENVIPKSYITNKCNKYGIKSSISDAEVYDKLTIGCGESEISVINNILLDSKTRVWFSVDTLYTGEWNTNSNPVHVFTHGNTGVNGIPIIDIELIEDGTDMISELALYGSDSDGNQSIANSASNSYMTSKGIQKRKTRRKYSDSAVSKYISVADRDIRDNFRDNVVMNITAGIRDAYLPNTTVQVIIEKLAINALFFVRGVNYNKTLDNGSVAILTLIQSDQMFESMWQNSSNMTVTGFTELSSKLANMYTPNVQVQSQDTQSSEYFAKCNYTGHSIVDGLKSVGSDSSYNYRKSIATVNNIQNYSGKASQNITMLNMLKQGILIRP